MACQLYLATLAEVNSACLRDVLASRAREASFTSLYLRLLLAMKTPVNDQLANRCAKYLLPVVDVSSILGGKT